MKFLSAFVCAVALFLTNAAAGDAPLTEEQAKRFVATLPVLDDFGETLEAEDKISQLMIDSKPKAGEPFKPYSRAVTALSEAYPADHARLAKALKPHGFTTQEWGVVGDRIMIAYLALAMAEQDPETLAMMEGMDASMLDMVPPEMRAQLEQTFAMMETVKNAPQADKDVVATVKASLDDYVSVSE